VIIMDQGRIIADDTLDGLRSRAVAGTDLVFDLEVVPDGLVANLGDLPGVHSAEVIGNQLRVRVDALDAGLAVLLPELKRREARILHVGSARPSLESIFLQLTGRSLRDG
jgi:ABC-2 type transport system ATP-binding protein